MAKRKLFTEESNSILQGKELKQSVSQILTSLSENSTEMGEPIGEFDKDNLQITIECNVDDLLKESNSKNVPDFITNLINSQLIVVADKMFNKSFSSISGVYSVDPIDGSNNKYKISFY